ncbi:hypothetical protein AGR5A_Cc20391 [Agrobacterium genomosp. 5 str. CFBP 6626]|nr:hypothetical protein AGR5A_Cc20391 [Agrobacterium genomosp. 5 str. CFBP 6626]
MAVAVVAVMSVQPTSEKRTVPQLAGSAAPAALNVMTEIAAAKARQRLLFANIRLLPVFSFPCHYQYLPDTINSRAFACFGAPFATQR